MILVFEPQCRGFAHEQFNAGFLYGYSLAYPDEKIVFWAEKEHIKCVQAVFSSAGMTLSNIEFVETDIPLSNELSRLHVISTYYQVFKKLLRFASENNCSKIVLLSVYSYNLLPLKFLLLTRYKDIFHFHMMMHGALESIKKSNFSIPFAVSFIGFVKGLRKHLGLAKRDYQLRPTNEYLYEKLFKMSLELFGNNGITYYVFREDSLSSIGKYLPHVHHCFVSIDLPYVYKDLWLQEKNSSSNKKVFATIGRGDIASVQKVVHELEKNNRTNVDDLEIRIVGPAPMKQKEFSLIKYVGNGQILSRTEMEEQMEAVQYLLFFFGMDSYELTTSGSFLDAVAYRKPMVFLKNPCFDFYFRNYKFGYRCENTDELARVIQRITANDDGKYSEFCSELERLQRDISISNTYPKLRFV